MYPIFSGENFVIKILFKLVFFPKQDLTFVFYYLNTAFFVLI